MFSLYHVIFVSQRLISFFSSSPELRELAQRTRRLAVLQRLYREATPPALIRASRVIGFEKHILTLGADNSAVAAKLRQLAPQILLNIQGNDSEVTGILVKVQVNQPVARGPAGHTLSDGGRRQLAEFAATMKDSPLKNALQRLIRAKSR